MAQIRKTDAELKKDRLRFTKNKLSANLILLAIAANALYFVSIYGSDVGSYYYSLFIGASIVYNLVFMLLAFLSSEGVKSYKLGYAVTAIVLGVLQVARIFYIPMKAYNAPNPVVGAETSTVMAAGQFKYVAVCLCISAVLLACAGLIGIVKTTTLNKYQAELDNMSFLENDVMQLHSLFKPLQNSAQMTSDPDNTGGAPQKEIGELTDSGEQNREDGDDW